MNKYSGGNFDDFLKEEGIFEEVLESTRKRMLALQIEDCINAASPKKVEFADRTSISFVQLNHYLFDLDNTVITSELLNHFALEATEMKTNPVQLNDLMCDSEELLDRFLTDELAA